MAQFFKTVIAVLLMHCAASASLAQQSADEFSRDTQDPLYVVKFVEPGLLYYEGGINGLAATSPMFRQESKFNHRSPATRAYGNYLKGLKPERVTQINALLGRDIKVQYHYKAIHHGVLVAMNAEEAARVRSLPEVAEVTPEPVYHIDTDRGPIWINANAIWDGSSIGLGSIPNKGEGIVVGVIDTGVNSDHPSFAEVGPVDGYVHQNPNGAGQFIGHCIGGDNDGNPAPNAEIQCNNKLIGAWALTNASDTLAPEDSNGHGSHTASTAAGNTWQGPFFDVAVGVNIGVAEISGVAPHANVIAYDVCETNTCSATTAGIDRAIQDGVDVINFSISGGTSPWNDNDRQFLDAVNAGIFVAASAGNTRETNTNPVADVAHRGPWVMTVAASTHDRDGNGQLTNMSGGNTAPPSTIDGQTGTVGHSGAIVFAGDFSNGDPDPEQCLNPFPPGTWTNNEIVVCDRGAIARVEKGVNVQSGGAGGLVLANIDGGATSVVADFHVLPALHIDNVSGNALKAWLATGSGHSAEIIGSSGASNPASADVLAGFSLRGPNLSFDVSKPDITGPGVSILAAELNNGSTPPGSAEVGFKNGTSMSSPHLAGSGALMKAAQPKWSVPEIKSAMMMTADLTGRKEDNSTPVDTDDVGTGRVDLALATRAGLVMDESFANFLAANPGIGGDPKTLNIPSARNSTCGASCNWTRVLKDVMLEPSNWTVTTVTDGTFTLNASPSTFNLPGNDLIYTHGFDGPTGVSPTTATQSITITASGVPTNTTGMSFGQVILAEEAGNSPELIITVTVNQVLPFGGSPPPD